MFGQHSPVELSTGMMLSLLVKAVNLNTWHIAGKCNAVAVWLKGQDEPHYFPKGSADADAVEAWAATQPGEQFLHLPFFFFAIDTIEAMGLDDTGNAWVQLEGDPLYFDFQGSVVARMALLLWMGEDVTEQFAAVLD